MSEERMMLIRGQEAKLTYRVMADSGDYPYDPIIGKTQGELREGMYLKDFYIGEEIRLNKFLRKQRDDSFEAALLYCPACRYAPDNMPFAHAGEPYVEETDNYEAWSGRGKCVVIPYCGECGHYFEVCFGFHKGFNYAFVRILRPVKEGKGG